MLRLKFFSVALLALFALSPCVRGAVPDLILEGTVQGSQNHHDFAVPFRVPSGVHRISVDFSYTNQAERTVLNLGLADPLQVRGWSGSNKSHVTLSETDATPSYLPGSITEGEWKLLIGVSNIRSTQNSHYRAEIRFNYNTEDQSFTRTPLSTDHRWYRGDLHMHTAHSDGSCISQSGRQVPCPLFFTVQTAATRGLDFIAITDHNSDAHYSDMRELQPYFDRLLLIPGREMTSFWGHFNIYGLTRFIDYRATAGEGMTINDILRQVRADGGIASINHPLSEGGEICRGCHWEPPMQIDFSLLTSVEIINGGREMQQAMPFWNEHLAQGEHLTGVGGSDNHNALSAPGSTGSIGWPTTVVEADELSVAAILDGIRRGRVFVDLTASRDRVLDLEVVGAQAHARMGESIEGSAQQQFEFTALVSGCSGSSLQWFFDGNPLSTQKVDNANARLHTQWNGDGKRHWLYAEIQSAEGERMMVSNPVYIHADNPR